MKVISADPYQAWCQGFEETVTVDTLLVGKQPPGTWLLVFQGMAREVMSEERARRVLDALDALRAVARGETFDHLFPDLVGREPQLPDFLRPS